MSWSSGFNDNAVVSFLELLFWLAVLVIEWAFILGVIVGIPVLVLVALVKYIVS